jgi:hypothetical protein
MSTDNQAESLFGRADPSGLTTISIGRTIGEGDFSLLTNLTWLTGEAHVNRLLIGGDEDARVLPPIIVAAVGLGLGWTSTMRAQLLNRFGLQAVKSTFLTVVGGVPVRPGDTLRVWTQVNSAVADEVGSKGTLDITHEVRNQFEQTAVTLTQQLLVAATETIQP